MRNSSDMVPLKRLLRLASQTKIRLLLLIIFNAILAASATFAALYSKDIIDSATDKDAEGVKKYAVLLAVIIAVQLFMRIASRALEEVIRAKLEYSARTDVFNALLVKDYAKVKAFHSGELMTRLTNDINVISEGVATIVPQLVQMITRLCCAFGALVILDRSFAIFFVVAGGVVFVVTRACRNVFKRLHRDVQEADGKARSFMQEMLEGLLAIKVFNAESIASAKSGEYNKHLFDAKIRKRNVSVAANTGFHIVFRLGFLYAIIWSAYRLLLGAITAGTVTAILQLVNQVQLPFANISGLVPRYYSVLGSTERLMALELLPDEPEDRSIDVPSFYESLHGLRCSNMSFSYDREPVLREADLYIRKRDFVAVTGISGIGKSTLLKLLLGVYALDEGKVCFECKDGTRLAGKSTRRLFSYVPQGNMLFSATIRENLLLFNPDRTDEQIAHALKTASADRFITEFPLGLDTVIGENGSGLSEGQAQRIAIARAVLSDAPIMLLDEATSALDEATECEVLSALRAIPDKTCIIITHKPAALAICNRRVSIQDLKLVEDE